MDLTILLYGRLSFLSSGERLTVRYNTLFRRQLDTACRDEALEVFANGFRLRLPMSADLAQAAIEWLR